MGVKGLKRMCKLKVKVLSCLISKIEDDISHVDCILQSSSRVVVNWLHVLLWSNIFLCDWLVFNSKGITSMKKAINNCLKAIICGRTSFLRGDCKQWNHFHPYQKCLNYYKNTQGWILESFIWSKTINFNVVILSECHCKNFGVRQVVKQPLGLVGWSPWICPNTSSLAADCSNYGLNLA